VTKCEQCGATIDPMAMACPYCHLTTPAGVVASQRGQADAQAHAQWAAAVEFQKRQATQMQIMSAANQAILFSIGGMVLCCTPLGIVGVVQSMRARSMATAQKLEIPGRATIGLVLAICSCVLSVGLIIAAAINSSHDTDRANARIAELDKLIGTKSANATLDRAVACELAEQTALRDGWDGHQGGALEKIDCPGALTQNANTAQLEDFGFNWSTTRYKTFACFKHGAKWYVEELSDASCDTETTASASSSASTPAPTTSAPPHKSTGKHTH
jgi:hypothetical protein